MAERFDARGRPLKRVQYTVSGGGAVAASGDVTTARNISEVPEVQPTPVVLDELTAQLTIAEGHPVPATEEGLAVLFSYEETHPLPAASEQMDALVMLGELHPAPVSTESLDLVLSETQPDPLPVEQWIVTLIDDYVLPTPAELLLVQYTAVDNTQSPTPSENVSLDLVLDELHPSATDLNTVVATVASPANAATTSTGMTNPANAADYDDDAATSAATSSGLTQGTSNTTAFTMAVGFTDFDLSYLTTVSAVSVDIATAVDTSGSAATGGSHTVTLEYTLDGTNWVALAAARTAVYSTLAAPDTFGLGVLTNTQLNALQVRARGSVTSGTGLLAATTRTFSFYKAQIRFTASRSA